MAIESHPLVAITTCIIALVFIVLSMRLKDPYLAKVLKWTAIALIVILMLWAVTERAHE